MITAADILLRLYDRFSDKNWVCFTELRECAGFSGGGIRSIDFAAIHKWPSHGHKFVCFEIKTTRQDFLKELDNPAKRAPWMDAAHEFWFVAPYKS